MEYNSEGSLEKVETFYADVCADLITETNAPMCCKCDKAEGFREYLLTTRFNLLLCTYTSFDELIE